MNTGVKNAATMVGGAILVALVAYVIYDAAESGPGQADPSTSTPSDEPLHRDEDTVALPAGLDRLKGIVELATEQARQWRPDARLTRLYATELRVDGAFDSSGSSVQAVFVSQEATSEGQQANGFRFFVQQGRYAATPIWLYPPPELDDRPIRLCPLASVAGEEAPERFTLDTHYAQQGKREPSLLLFTRRPKRWMVAADPFTCEVRDRSRALTVEEQRERAAALDAAGARFDAREATAAITAAIEASSCRDAGAARGPGTVQVRFTKQGDADHVEFLAGSYEGTPTARCLRQALLQVRVAPWQQGDGVAAARFRW